MYVWRVFRRRFAWFEEEVRIGMGLWLGVRIRRAIETQGLSLCCSHAGGDRGQRDEGASEDAVGARVLHCRARWASCFATPLASLHLRFRSRYD